MWVRIMLVAMWLLLPLLCATPAAAQSVPLGIETKGEITGPWQGVLNDPRPGHFYSAEVSVVLQAGKSYRVRVDVAGKGRKVGIHILDPANEAVTPGWNWANLKDGGVEFEAEDLAAKGKYRVVITSTQIGEYKLTVTDLGDVAGLESRIATLKAELAIAEKALRVTEGAPKSADSKTELVGEIAGERGSVQNDPRPGVFYQHEVTIPLKAGRSYNFHAKGNGKGRKVGIHLIGPEASPVTLGWHWADLKEGGVTYDFEDVAAKGKYRVIVTSDRIGGYTLTVTDNGEAATLERRITTLKRELTLAQEQLQAAKSN